MEALPAPTGPSFLVPRVLHTDLLPAGPWLLTGPICAARIGGPHPSGLSLLPRTGESSAQS